MRTSLGYLTIVICINALAVFRETIALAGTLKNIYYGYRQLKSMHPCSYPLKNITYAEHSGLVRMVFRIITFIVFSVLYIPAAANFYSVVFPVSEYFSPREQFFIHIMAILIFLLITFLVIGILADVIIICIMFSDKAGQAILTETGIISLAGIFTGDMERFSIEKAMDPDSKEEFYIKVYRPSGKKNQRDDLYRFKILRSEQAEEIEGFLENNF